MDGILVEAWKCLGEAEISRPTHIMAYMMTAYIINCSMTYMVKATSATPQFIPLFVPIFYMAMVTRRTIMFLSVVIDIVDIVKK